MIYVPEKKLITVPIGWKDQIMQFLHKKYMGSMYRGHNIIMLNRRESEPKYTELKNTSSRSISDILEVRVGGNSNELVTLAPVHD